MKNETNFKEVIISENFRGVYIHETANYHTLNLESQNCMHYSKNILSCIHIFKHCTIEVFFDKFRTILNLGGRSWGGTVP